MARTSPLAIHGGEPTYSGAWPTWPQHGPDAVRAIGEQLCGGRWAVSGEWTGELTADERFAQRFAEFVGARWCVPTDHGSSALLGAMTALGIGPGDEVVVPGLTWVACASTVLRAGAMPVLADVEPETLCVSPEAVAAAITPRTAAILVVHLYSAMAEMDRLGALAARHGLPLIEDAAQAHGARWRDRPAGSIGIIGAFSMQQGKVLTSGEGGAAVTSDATLRDSLEQLRGDGRRYQPVHQRRVGRPDLTEADGPQGWNMHLSELQACLLLDGLARLPAQNQRRAVAAAALDEAFRAIPGCEPIRPHPANTQRTYYHYAVRLDLDEFKGRPIETVCEAVSAEIGFWVKPPYQPLSSHPLYRPDRHPLTSGAAAGWEPTQSPLPEAHRQVAKTLTVHHCLLLADPAQVRVLVEAVDKVRRNAHLLEAGS